MICPTCPHPVPVVSQRVANDVVSRLPPLTQRRASIAALEWLTARHEGLTLYVGIHGRPYTWEEKRAISHEISAVADLGCPFRTLGGCLLGGLGPLYRPDMEVRRPPYGWLPTLIARAIDSRTYSDLVRCGGIADAKVSLLTRNEGLQQPKEVSS